MKDVSLIIYTATDMDAAKQFFSELTGGEPYVDSPYYVGYKHGEVEIGLTQRQSGAQPSALAYWDVPDIAAKIAALEAAGGTLVQPITDVGHGLLVASVKDSSGSTIGLRQKPG